MFGALSGSGDVDLQLSDLAWLQAMLDVEAALARAGARAGLVPAAAAAEIGASRGVAVRGWISGQPAEPRGGEATNGR